MTEAILAFYSENVWSQQHTRYVKKTSHWILQTVGSLVAILGMIIEFMNKQRHFTTTHAILGLVAGIFTLIGMLNGVTALFSVELKKRVKPIYFKMAHNITGMAAFVLGKSVKLLNLCRESGLFHQLNVQLFIPGMTALHFGYDRKYMIKNSREDIRMWLQIFAIITIVLSIVGALRSLLKQLRIVFR